MEFAYIHEDMVNTIEELINEWTKNNCLKVNNKVYISIDYISNTIKSKP